MSLAKFKAFRPDLYAVAALAALWALFFWRLLTPNAGDRVLFAKGDFTEIFVSISHFQAERIWAGQLPLWNPYKEAGAPLAAETQWGTWYAPRWIAILAAGPGGWSPQALQLEAAAHYLLASILAYLFFRVSRHGLWASLAGGLIFGYGGFLTGYPMLQLSILESAAWLPLALLGARVAATQDRWIGGGLIAGLGLGLSMLAGHVQTVVSVFYLTLAYLITQAIIERRSFAGIAARASLVVGVMAGVSAIQWLPTVELITLSPRLGLFNFDFKGSGYVFADLLRLIWPVNFGQGWSALYAGVAGLLLAAFALFRPKPIRVFWAVALVAGLLLSVGARSAEYGILYAVAPGFGLFRQQERSALIVSMALAALAAWGFDDLLAANRDKDDGDNLLRQRQFRRLAAGHALLAAVALILWPVGLQFSAINITLDVLAYVAFFSLMTLGWQGWLRSSSGLAPRLAVIALIALDLFTVGQQTPNYVPDTVANQTLPPKPKRMQAPDGVEWHVDGSGGVQGRGTLFRIPDIYGETALELESVVRLREIPVDRLWEILAVRYATLAGVFPPDTVKVVALGTYPNYDGAEYISYELQDPRPFAWLVYDFREASGSPEFARQIIADPRVNLREIAVTLYPPPIALPGQRPTLSAVTEYRMVTPERIEMTVSTGENAILTLALPKYPGWRATIDGQPAEIIDVYAGLVGVPIAAGENQKIVVEFAPMIQVIAGAISALSLVGLIGYGVWRLRLGNRQNHSSALAR